MRVMSSAYEAMYIWGMGGAGKSCKYSLKREGEIGDPWGTPFLMFLVVDDWPLNDTCALLPAR